MAKSPKSEAELLKLKAQIDAMTAADRLRLAAGLIEQGNLARAETIADHVVMELKAARLLGPASGLRKGRP